MRAKQLQRIRRALTPLLATIAILALAGCGGDDNPGEGEPKRAVDPRTEALRYFPATTPGVALVELGDDEALAALDGALGRVAGWHEVRQRVIRSLRAAGLDPAHILELGSVPGDEIELPAAEIAYGTVPGSGPPEDRILLTLATEQGVALDQAFRGAAEAGSLSAAGEFDGARLYRGPDLDFAVRDGVLIAAADINRLQQAIARRDGAREAQLNDAPITELFNELPNGGPLRAWMGPGTETEALLTLLAAATGQEGAEEAAKVVGAASEAAVEISANGGRLGIELIVRSGGAETPEDSELEVPSEDDPVPLSITVETVEQAFTGLPARSSLHALARVAPLAGATWLDGSYLRARLIASE
jgi:hypothetical protein